MNIYKIKHIPSGKIYIGQTISSTSDRFSSHKSKLRKNKHSNSYLQNYWNKYGEEEFIFIPVCRASSLEELNQLEEILIQRYKAHVTLGGFNLKKGGDNHKMASSTKLLISKKLIGNRNGTYNKGISRPNGMAGIPKSDETKKKISQTLKGRKIPRSIVDKFAKGHFKAVKQFTLEDEYLNTFESLKAASEWTGANRSMISLCISGKKKTAGGYRWSLVDNDD